MSVSPIRRVAAGTRRRARQVVLALLGRPAEAAAPPAPAPRLPADVRLLVGSRLFDHEWYARQTGVRRPRAAAAAHYLAQPRGPGRAHPHPLFDPDYYVGDLPDQLRADLGETDPLVFYLRRRTWRLRTHPLFDTRGYLRRNPDARRFRGGPLAHYVEVGRIAGAKPNDLLPPDEQGRNPDLLAWLDARVEEWRERRDGATQRWRARYDSEAESAFRERHGRTAPPTGEGPLVTVVLEIPEGDVPLGDTLRGLAAQTLRSWELLAIVPDGAEQLAQRITAELPDVRTTVVAGDEAGVGEGTNRALAVAGGRYVAFARPGDEWHPDRLRLLTVAADAESARMVADVLGRESVDGTLRYAADGHPGGGVRNRDAIDIARLLFERSLLEELGGVDTTLLGHRDFDLVLRASHRAPVTSVPVLGVTRRSGAGSLTRPQSPAEEGQPSSWRDVALNRRLIDWESLAARDQERGTVSVLIPTYQDWEMTTASVGSVVASQGHAEVDVQCIVWDNGSSAAVSAVLDALPLRFPGVVVAHSADNHGFALGNNLALPLARGATVVFLNNDTTVPPDWLVPVVRRLAEPGVLGVQSLLVYPTGTVQSAGVAFPSTGGLAHPFLQGFPVEDAEGVDDLEFSALTGAALALRWEDVVAVHGFDPIFTNGMEDVDLCQRLSARREGAFRVVTESPVVHYESRSPGRYERAITNRRIYLDRWRGVAEPRDDARLWAHQGFRVLDHEVVRLGKEVPRQWLVPMPVLVREARLAVSEGPPLLRWAIKNAAPPGRSGDRWGDTQFADAIARALRRLGQQVVIDRRPEFERATSRHDDVALALLGRAPYWSSPEHVTICWVISHPELADPAQLAACDRVVAASSAWARSMSRAWGFRIDPMLQATDPALFHPDRGRPGAGHRVLFVGSSRGAERPIVRDAIAAGLPLSVYGHDWRGHIDGGYVKGRRLAYEDLGAAYRSAGVVLNDHWSDMREQGFLSNRLFDAVASGARVITDDVVGLREVFGDSVQVYRTPEDLVRLSSLADPAGVFGGDDALRAAAARIHREHSFDARARQLLDIAVEERRRRGFCG